jgi:nucleoside-diphosphate-sugar epimerase
VHVPTLRLYSAFGPYEDGRRLIPALVAHALRGRLPPLASPATARDYVYVDDVVEAYLLAASVPGQETGAVYNVGSGVQTSLADLVAEARRLFGVAAAPVWESYGARDWDTSVWVAAPQRIRAALGWKPEYDLERGLRSMAAWLQAHRHLYPELFPA